MGKLLREREGAERGERDRGRASPGAGSTGLVSSRSRSSNARREVGQQLRPAARPPHLGRSDPSRHAAIRSRRTEDCFGVSRSRINAGKKPGEFLFNGRGDHHRCMTTRQYARLVSSWVATIGLDPHFFGTHSLLRTKTTFIYRRTGNLRAVQLLLGHTKIESTVRHLGIEVDDALAIAEQVGV
jgi:hypothetical protein